MQPYKELVVQRKLDPDWPKCRDCREPISKHDLEHPYGKTGFCWSCYDARHPHPWTIPVPPPPPDLSSLGLLDKLED
jgi:hypothetical protein